MAEYKTTEEHFETFKAQVQKELKKWGINSYEFRICHEDCNDEFTLADVEWSQQNRWAKFRLNVVWPEEITIERLKMTAFHEVMELLFSPMYFLAIHSNEFTPGQISSVATRENHSIIRTLENVIGYEK